jgi:hypothetical protein
MHLGQADVILSRPTTSFLIHVRARAPWSGHSSLGVLPVTGTLVPAANDFARALSQAAGLRLRGEGKPRRLWSDSAGASSGHHDMGASAAPVPTVRPPAAPGVTKDDYSPYTFVIFPGPTPPATLSTAGRRRCRLLHKYVNNRIEELYCDD